MEYKKEYIDRMTSRIRELEIEIKQLEEIVDKAVAEVKAEYQQQLDEVFLKKEEVSHKLLTLGQVSGNVWEDMKAGAEISWQVYEDSRKKQSGK